MKTGTRVNMASFILALLVMFASIVSVTAISQARINQNIEDINTCKVNIDSLNHQAEEIRIGVVVIQTQYGYIKESLDHINAKLEAK